MVKKKARQDEKWIPQKKAVFDVMALIWREWFKDPKKTEIPFWIGDGLNTWDERLRERGII